FRHRASPRIKHVDAAVSATVLHQVGLLLRCTIKNLATPCLDVFERKARLLEDVFREKACDIAALLDDDPERRLGFCNVGNRLDVVLVSEFLREHESDRRPVLETSDQTKRRKLYWEWLGAFERELNLGSVQKAEFTFLVGQRLGIRDPTDRALNG